MISKIAKFRVTCLDTWQPIENLVYKIFISKLIIFFKFVNFKLDSLAFFPTSYWVKVRIPNHKNTPPSKRMAKGAKKDTDEGTMKGA